MFRDRPSISLGPIGVGLSSLTRRKCCGLLMLAPIGMVVPSLRATTGPIQENADRAEDDQRALKDFLEAYHLAPGQILERVPRLGQKASGRGGNISILTTGTSLTNSGLWSSVRDPDQFDHWGGTTGEGFSLRQLLRYLETNIYELDIDGDRKLLDTIVSGDWVYRDGVDVERMVHGSR